MQNYDRNTWAGQLHEGLVLTGIELSEMQKSLLLDYLALLLKWNQAYNLTAVRDPDEMVSRHLLDSLSILSLVRGPRVLDVGTGAGLPGIPLAIARPDLHFVLLDSNGKKTRFVKQVVMTLSLENVQVVQSRVEAYEDKQGFDTITTRAFAALPGILADSQHLLGSQGQWLAMKGAVPDQELEQLARAYKPEVAILDVPGEKGERHAIIIRPRAEAHS